jgi:hypothetical protein
MAALDLARDFKNGGASEPPRILKMAALMSSRNRSSPPPPQAAKNGTITTYHSPCLSSLSSLIPSTHSCLLHLLPSAPLVFHLYLYSYPLFQDSNENLDSTVDRT